MNEPIEVDLVPDVEKCEVLLDSCGPRGVFTGEKNRRGLIAVEFVYLITL